MSIESFKQLKVWQKSIDLVKETYKATGIFPKSELYGLSSQMRRAAVSISSNISEGYRRRNRGEYIQFLNIANASTAELETQIIISREIYPEIDFKAAYFLLIEVQKMLSVLISRLHPLPFTLNPKQHVQKTD